MTTKKRGNGEGSIYQRKDGKWVASVTIGYDENGKRIRKDIYGKTKKEVQDKLLRIQSEMLTGTYTEPQKLTMATYLNKWLEDSVRTSTRESTYRCYSNIVRNHIIPHLGGVQLARINPSHVQSLYASMKLHRSFKDEKSLSPRMKELTHAVLRRALKQAVKWGYVQRNPCDAVDRPKVARPTMKYFTPEEAKRLLEASREDRLHALYVLAVTTGLRQGELLGLYWKYVDLKGGAISVVQTLLEHGGELKLGEPKTSKGKRMVHLPEFALAALREHRDRMTQEAHQSELVFCDEGGVFLLV